MNKSNLDEILKRLDTDQSIAAYNATANALNKLTAQECGLPSFRIAILRNFTVEPLLPIIKSEVARMGFFPEIYLGNYDAIAAEVMDEKSKFYAFKPHFVILAQWLDNLARELMKSFIDFSKERLGVTVDRIFETITTQIRQIRKLSIAIILINNFPLPYPMAFRILEGQREDMQRNTIRKINLELRRLTEEFRNVFIVDYEYLMARVGLWKGYDERYWQMAGVPFSQAVLLPFAFEYIQFIRAFSGKTYKCIILDCDNTLWGGVIGEDGLEGIKLDTTYPGSCYVAFQKEILKLHNRGIILALCSKNNEADVLEVFRKHPDIVLKENHFATWKINWEDKAANIRKIVEELNIGMDHVVFVDDSEYEIGLVKFQIPEIQTILLPSEPSQLRLALLEKGYFDSLSLTQEDKDRTKMYKEEATRRRMYSEAKSIEDYLTELQIVAHIGIPGSFHIPRVAQLTQKTNQFNLTTRRYTEGDIETFVKNNDADVWYLHLKDKISDLGLVGTGIIKYNGSVAEIDSFLLSCRILGRNAEDAFLSYMIQYVKDRGYKTLLGRYIRSSKNQQVADFYKRRGFVTQKEGPQESEWRLDLKNFVFQIPKWITIKTDDKSI